MKNTQSPITVSPVDAPTGAVLADPEAWVAACLAPRRDGASAHEVRRLVGLLGRWERTIVAYRPASAAVTFEDELETLARG